jgi:hypothetical protein
MRASIRILTIFTLIFISTGTGHAADAVKHHVMFIIDASGSMDSPMGSKSKIALVKDALGGIIKEFPSDVNAGLISYGLHRQGDCNDVEELVPLASSDKKRFIQKLESITPKGMSAIFLSIRKAAEKLKGLKEECTIVLISDGQDNCKKDPCQLTQELKKQEISFSLHVIGLDVREEEAVQLSCMAKAGNGAYFPVKTEDELTRYLRKAMELSEINFAKTSGKPQKTEPSPISIVESEKLTITATNGRIRKDPSLKSKVLFVLKKNDQVSVLERKGDWYRVQTGDNKSGWAHRSIFETTKAAPQSHVRELMDIKASVMPDGDEKVVFVFDDLSVPKTSVLKEAIPKVICDFSDIRISATIGHSVKVKGHLIAKIRIGKQNEKSLNPRIVLDLFPNRPYTLNQISSKEDNTHTIILTPDKRSK